MSVWLVFGANIDIVLLNVFLDYISFQWMGFRNKCSFNLGCGLVRIFDGLLTSRDILSFVDMFFYFVFTFEYIC